MSQSWTISRRGARGLLFLGALLLLGLPGWLACDGGSRCGPLRAVVTRVIDGDTIELASGEHVRYILVNTPEITAGKNECYGAEAKTYNESLVLDREVRLSYHEDACQDRYDRLLAYVEVFDRELNLMMIENGYACVLYIPPHGTDRLSQYKQAEALARAQGLGMWGACPEVTCD